MKLMRYLLTALLVLVAAPTGALAAPEIAVVAEKSKEIVKITTVAVSPRSVFTLTNPHRLVVDVPWSAALSQTAIKKIALPKNYRGKLAATARAAKFDAKTVRFVFEMRDAVEVGRVSVKTLKNKLRVLSIEVRPVPAASVAHKPFAASNNLAQDDDGDKNRNEARGKTVRSAALGGKGREGKRKSPKPVVVIDPGHGGVDPGAIGPAGTQEKDVVLTYARALKARLGQTGQYNVKLTREDDRIIPLRERIAIARKAGASIFISLHADSAEAHDARGSSVYTLSETASDIEAESLAARENKVDILAGVNLTNEREDVADILISLAQRETNNRSATLADMLVISMIDKVRLLPNTHRFAGFAVLKAPDVPSVLVEIGFLSHPLEEKQLKTKAHREKVVASLAHGIDAYFQQKKKMGGE